MRKLARAVGDAVLPALSRWDPERAHDWGLSGLQCLAPFWPAPAVGPALAMYRFGLAFAHPLGLAAGFDKNGDYLDALGALGFSHIELGTVTPRPQSGNPKPRMFRAPSAGGLVNRMGFNNKGVDHLVARLGRARYTGIRGVSIGKNADTPLEQAPQDYLACLEKVYPLADYVAVNVSSPNTARLRELQAPDGSRASSHRSSSRARGSRRAMGAASRCSSKSRRIWIPRRSARWRRACARLESMA